MRAFPILLPALLLTACGQETPVPFSQANLGVRATFPGAYSQSTFVEENCFGTMQWLSFSHSPAGRLDTNFRVDVGSIPPGTQGGSTVPEALASFQAFLGRSLGVALPCADLGPDQGPGFRYSAQARGGFVEGLVILRRSRIHHAQVTVPRAGDPRAQAFLDSFQVD
jgi:hypothetical protein